jgi:hypothetical protein
MEEEVEWELKMEEVVVKEEVKTKGEEEMKMGWFE